MMAFETALHPPAPAAVTKDHRPGDLNHRSVLSDSSEGEKSKVKISPSMTCRQCFLPGSSRRLPSVPICVLISLLIRSDASLIQLGAI